VRPRLCSTFTSRQGQFFLFRLDIRDSVPPDLCWRIPYFLLLFFGIFCFFFYFRSFVFRFSFARHRFCLHCGGADGFETAFRPFVRCVCCANQAPLCFPGWYVSFPIPPPTASRGLARYDPALLLYILGCLCCWPSLFRSLYYPVVLIVTDLSFSPAPRSLIPRRAGASRKFTRLSLSHRRLRTAIFPSSTDPISFFELAPLRPRRSAELPFPHQRLGTTPCETYRSGLPPEENFAAHRSRSL